MLGKFDCYSDTSFLIVDADEVKTAQLKFIWAQANSSLIVTLDYIATSEAHGLFLEIGPFEVVNIRGLDDHIKNHQKWLS